MVQFVIQFVTQSVALMLAAISLACEQRGQRFGNRGASEHAPGVSDVWQAKGLQERVFVSVAMIGLSRRFPGSVANTGLNQRVEIGTAKNGPDFGAPLGILDKRAEAAGNHFWKLP